MAGGTIGVETRRESDWRRIHVFVAMTSDGHLYNGVDCWCEPRITPHETVGEIVRLFIHSPRREDIHGSC